MDLVLAALGIVLFAPILVIVSLLVYLFIGPPVLFRQLRPGLHGRPFEIIKFRSMREAYDEEGQPLPDEERLGRFGTMLRSTSLDELPELWNVLKGDMSLVGPRPLCMEYLPLYNEEQARRHCVRPGITGWAQVNGRNSITWEKKFELDVWYVDNGTVLLDIKILFLTIRQILNRRGVTSETCVTMEDFNGS
ncbi:sugar transferase [Halomonas sp. LR3S48]|uniref:sugar transferase n=1 Tax=Halomonadaceae TaxID=28256 RepID=UPI002963D759|nr:sugar transferase [Halomonas sp. LR3S48]